MSCHGGGSGEDQGPCSRLGLTHRRRVGAQLSRGAVDGPAPASICPVSDDQCVCGAHVTHTALLGSPNKPGASSVFPPKIQLPTRCSVKPEMSVATAGNSRTVLMPVAHHGCPIRARGPAHVRLKENGPGASQPAPQGADTCSLPGNSFWGAGVRVSGASLEGPNVSNCVAVPVVPLEAWWRCDWTPRLCYGSGDLRGPRPTDI